MVYSKKTLNRQGYRYLHSRKKGLMTRKDVVRRYRFACKIRRLLPMNFWERVISFYFDGTSFVHKINPFDQARELRNPWPGEGRAKVLHSTVQQKEKGWRRGQNGTFLRCIAYGKGMESCDQYFHRLKGESFADYVRLRFPQIFSPVPIQQLNSFYKTGIQFKTVLQQDVLSKKSEQ